MRLALAGLGSTRARRVLDVPEFEIDNLHSARRWSACRRPGYRAVRTLPGIGPVLGAVFVAEIGDVRRFPNPHRLASWAGLTKHHESDTKVHRGRITNQGSRLVRWAAVEAVQRAPKTSRVGLVRDRVGARRGRNIGVVAAARELVELSFYALRDGHVRLGVPSSAAA